MLHALPAIMNDETDLERRAGKKPADAHPEMSGGTSDPDPSDYADPRVAQPGEEPVDEDALHAPKGTSGR